MEIFQATGYDNTIFYDPYISDTDFTIRLQSQDYSDRWWVKIEYAFNIFYPYPYIRPNIGFLINYQAYKYMPVYTNESSVECSGSFDGVVSGVIQSPDYPDNYPDNVHCQWNITVAVGRKIYLNFTNLEVSILKLTVLSHIMFEICISSWNQTLTTCTCTSSTKTASLTFWPYWMDTTCHHP